MGNKNTSELQIQQVPISRLKLAEYNPRKHTPEALEQLKQSIENFGLVDPIICNNVPSRKLVVIGGHMRIKAAKALGYKDMPVVFVNIPDIKREKELNIRLNKNVGEWDYKLLAEFDEQFLGSLGFTSEELDSIFELEDTPEVFDLKKELEKLSISKIEMKTGDLWQLGSHRLLVGDSTSEENILKLMGGQKANAVITDPPYILDYLKGKKKNKKNEGFGYKRDRRYLGTDELPPDFTEKWMANIHKVQKDDFAILIYENWKNIRTIWNEMEKYWKVKNMIVWHLPNRVQGFAAKYKFFNKHDIAMVGTSKAKFDLNLTGEGQLLQNEYETALFAISGKPQWESYEKGKKYCPTDFIEYKASDEKSSGQGVIFGTKPVEILIPYIKVLSKRGDLILEPFGGSGSTLIAAHKLDRKCNIMEKSPVYAEVIKKRWEKLTGLKAKKIN